MDRGDSPIEDAEESSRETDFEGQGFSATSEEAKEKGETALEKDLLPFDAEFLQGAPPEVKQAIRMAFSMTRMAGPAPNPLVSAIAKTLDGDHLTGIIKSIDRGAELEASSAQNARWTNLVYLVVVLIFAGFVVWLLKDTNPDLVKDLVMIVASLAGGLGAGYGISTVRERKKK